MARFYLSEILTNQKLEDGSRIIGVYINDDPVKALNSAKSEFFNWCRLITNDSENTLHCVLMILDESGNVVGGPDGYKEIIDHPYIQPEPEPEPEPEPDEPTEE